MQLSDIPAKFTIPFASSAGVGFIRTIPTTPSGVLGQASLELGFPPENFSPVSAGGVPPFGQDFNGLNKQSTGWNRWQAAGVAFPPYDAAFQTAVGGYPRSAIVGSLVKDGLFYLCLVDNNVTNPDNGGAGWFIWSRIITANTDIYVNSATGNDNNNGLTPATAMATLQGAINRTWSYPPSQYTITIHLQGAGPYAGARSPLYPGPNTIINGDGIGTTLISATGDYGILVQGPNTMTVQNLKAQVSVAPAGAAAFAASNGATMSTDNTASGACGGPVFNCSAGGTLNIGSHNFNGNAYAAFWASALGLMTLLQSKTFTFTGSNTFSIATAFATGAGNIAVSATNPPTFVNPANAIGPKYSAQSNGIINANGQGVNFFPGSSAGSTATGGQYV